MPGSIFFGQFTKETAHGYPTTVQCPHCFGFSLASSIVFKPHVKTMLSCERCGHVLVQGAVKGIV